MCPNECTLDLASYPTESTIQFCNFSSHETRLSALMAGLGIGREDVLTSGRHRQGLQFVVLEILPLRNLWQSMMVDDRTRICGVSEECPVCRMEDRKLRGKTPASKHRADFVALETSKETRYVLCKSSNDLASLVKDHIKSVACSPRAGSCGRWK